MGYGMSFGAGLPSNYQNNLYWMYLMQSMQQAQQAQQALYEQRMQQLQQQQELQMQQQQLQQQQIMQQQALAQTQAQAPVDTMTTTQQQTVTVPAQVDGDGKDDGKISFGKKCKNFFKGVGNFFKGMVCDENGKFSLKRTLTTVGVAAGAVALTVATGGAATPFLVAAGATMAAVQTGKGVYRAATAKTDAEAEAAWQEIGSGTTALVGSVAGAKGALKAAGAPIPKGNAITSSLRATRDCFKIAGSGIAKGSKAAILHPMQSARAVKSYYQNTVKPNMQQAFSYKNGHKNYTEAMEQKFNKNIKDIDAKIQKLNDELTAGADAKRAVEINKEIARLNNEKLINEIRLNVNDGKNKALNTIEKEIVDVEAKLADPATSAADKVRLNAQREQLYQMADVIDSKYKIGFNKSIESKQQYIKSLQERLKTATAEEKPVIEAELKLNKQLLKGIKKQQQVEVAQHNVQKAEADIVRLNDQLRTATTDAQKQNITARIEKIEKLIAKDKQILRNANYRVAAQAHLPNVGLAYGTYYLANPAPQVAGQELSEADLIAQQYGFESAQAMQDYINAMNSSQQALSNADEFLSSQQTQQYATNPYNTGMYASTLPQPPMGSGLGFEDLYVSPYPPMY